MKKIITFLMAFGLVLLSSTGWGQYAGTGTFNKITSLGELTDGYYVILNETDAFVMTNGRSGSATTGYFVSASISVSNSSISDPATSNVWKIEVNGDGRTIYNEVIEKYVGWSSGNSASIEDAPANTNRWTFSYADSKFTVNNVAEPVRQLSYNSVSPRFAAYGNTGQHELQLYKMEEGGAAKPVITNITQDPATDITSATQVAVSADVAAGDAAINFVELRWGTASGVLGNTISMPGAGTYTSLTDIPAQANGTTVYYVVYAEDVDGESSTSAEQSYLVRDPATTTLPYEEDFASGVFGDIYTYTVAGNKPWAIVTGGAQANGYNGDDPEEHWLVLPGIDFNAYSDEVMTFTNFARYGTIDENNYLKLLYSTDYPGLGNPTTYTWNELTFDQPAAGSVGSTEIETASGAIDLSGIAGENVYLAFKYYSTDDPTSWRIDDILIYEDQSASEPTNHPTDFLATTNSSSEITLSWTDAVPAADGYLIKGSDVGYASITAPINGTPDANGALVQNVAAGVETYQFTGLNAETTYYFKIFPYNGLETTINYKTDGAPQDDATTEEAPATPIAWINEIHYDNDGGDVDELIEIVIKNPGNYDLSKFLVNLYNGNGGTSYDTETADDMTEGNTIDTYTFFTWSTSANGIQNGAPDGMALSYDGTLIQFLSYEGTFTATDGPANGIESTDIGVSETGTSPNNQSLQLSGSGNAYNDFAWQEPAIATPGTLNNNQFLPYETIWTGGASTTDWNTSANWSNGTPTSSANTTIGNAEIVVISSSTDADCYNLTLNGSLTIKSEATGTGSLLVNGIVDGTGSTTIERYVTGGENAGGGTSIYKYHLISIPLASDIQAGDVFTGTYLWHFVPNQADEASWLGITSLTENLDNQKGFLSYVADESDKFIFTGTMNNGDFTVAAENIDAGNVKLIPNPYPSAIDWEAVDLTDTGLNPTIWLFNSNTGNYESYNDGAGLGQQYIPVGQAVFVEAASADPSLTFTNAHRTHNQGNGFYKSGDELAKDLLKIAVSANNSSDATFIRFREQANNAYNGFDDATKLKGFSGAPQLFTHATDGKALSINTLATSQETVIVPLSFELDASGEAVLSFEYLETFEPEVEIYLEDLLTDQMINIRETGYYTFSHEVENDPLRFNLHFMGVTAVQDLRASENHFKIWTNENQLYILPTDKLTKGSLQIELFDLSGRLIQSVDKQVKKPVILSLPDYDGIMLVRIQNEKLVQTQKIFIR